MKLKQVVRHAICMLFHVKHWRKYVVCMEPYMSVAVCEKCFEDHIVKRGFVSEPEVNDKIDKALKMRLP